MIGSVELAQLIQTELQGRNLGGYVVKPGLAPRIEQDDPSLSSGLLAVVPVGDEFVRQTRRGSGISRIQVGVVLKKQRAPGSSESTDIGLATQKLRQVCSHLLTTPITAQQVRAESFSVEPAFDEDQLDQHHIIHLQAVLVYQVPTNAPAGLAAVSGGGGSQVTVTGTITPADALGTYDEQPVAHNGVPVWRKDETDWHLWWSNSLFSWMLTEAEPGAAINIQPGWSKDAFDPMNELEGSYPAFTPAAAGTATITVTPEAP